MLSSLRLNARICCYAIVFSPLFVFINLHLAVMDARGQDIPDIEWQTGPVRVPLGNVAQLEVPAGFNFTGAAGAKKWAELNQNPVSGQELGVLIPPITNQTDTRGIWSIAFEFDPIGYVNDADKNNLDSDTIAAIYESLRSGTELGNQERKRRGWPVLTLTGWEQKPFYDSQSHNLVWAIRGHTTEGSPVVNYQTRILGREGVMSANLVIDPPNLAATVPTYRMVIGGLVFNAGKRHEEFRSGDKVAQYGLIGLMTGTAAAVAVKMGFFAKYAKPLLVGLAAAVAAMWKKVLTRGSKGKPSHVSQTFAPKPTGSIVPNAVVVLTCSKCGQNNRIPKEKVGDRPLCGRCGTQLKPISSS